MYTTRYVNEYSRINREQGTGEGGRRRMHGRDEEREGRYVRPAQHNTIQNTHPEPATELEETGEDTHTHGTK